jgi:hypothetical protein
VRGGAIDELRVLTAPGTRAKRLVVGVYTDAGGHPGELLTTGALDNPVANAWNAVPLAPAQIVAGRPYWIAVLGTGGRLVVRDECCGSGSGSQPSETSASTTLSALPQTWQTGTVFPHDGPLSAYAPLE